MAEDSSGSEDEVIRKLKARLHRQWRRLSALRKQVHANQTMPYSDALELITNQARHEPPTRLPLVDNVVLKTRLKFHQFRGAYVRRVTHSQMLLQFNNSHNGCYMEPFMVQLEVKNGKYSVLKAAMPVSMRLSEIEETLSSNNNLLKFIHFVQACVDGYTFRKFDFNEFKELASKKFVENLRHSLNFHFIYMTMWLRDSSAKRVPLNITLKYEQYSCIPTGLKVVAVSEGDKEFAKQSEETLSYFLKVCLQEAFALGVKDDMNEMLMERSRNVEVSSISTEADSSRGRSARRVLRFASLDGSNGKRDSGSSSSEEEVPILVQQSQMKKISRASHKPLAKSVKSARSKNSLTKAPHHSKRQ